MYPPSPVRFQERPPPQYSYAGVLVRAERGAVLDDLVAAGFTGWIGPQEGDWVVIVPARRRGPVAARGAELERLGARVADRHDALTLAATVDTDRLLRLAAWDGPRELGRYVSNPAYGLPEDEDDTVFPEPEGVEHAEAFAAAFGKADEAEDLTELLGDMLDEEEQTESERLVNILRMFDLPRWLVAANSLPRAPAGGPRRAEFTRLFRGRTGVVGRVRSWLGSPVRLAAQVIGPLTNLLRRRRG